MKEWIPEPIGGAFEPPGKDKHMLGSLQQIHVPMRRFKDHDEVDYVIVGVGSAGGVLLQRLARAGFNVVGLEAGPFWDSRSVCARSSKVSSKTNSNLPAASRPGASAGWPRRGNNAANCLSWYTQPSTFPMRRHAQLFGNAASATLRVWSGTLNGS